MVAAAERLDFGDQGCETAFRWTLPVRNTTGKVLEIASFRTSCGCTKVEPTSLSLAPGATGEVTLVLDLTPQREGDFSLAERLFSVTVTPLLGSGAPLPGWTVTGRVLNPYETEPAYVTFQTPWIAGTVPPEKGVTVRCGVPLAGLTVRCDPQQAAVDVERLAGLGVCFAAARRRKPRAGRVGSGSPRDEGVNP